MATRLTADGSGGVEWLDTQTGEPSAPPVAPEPPAADPRRAWGRTLAGTRPQPSMVPLGDLAAEYGMTPGELLAVPGMAALAPLAREDFSGRVFLARADVAELVAKL